MGEILLEARGIKKTFLRQGAEIPVLQGVDFALRAGERVAIAGASGAGKSTFLHVLGTLEQPTAGALTFEGRDLLKMGEAEKSGFRNRELGFVFQFHYLLPECTALENVMMPALIGGEPFPKAEERARSLLETVGLTHRLEHRPSELSGGEQQRVAIARAIARKPRILLADELTGNLDSANREKIFELLLDLQKQTGVAILLVTHDEELASRMDRIVTMCDGRLV